MGVGPADDPATSIPPVIDQKAFDAIHKYIELGKTEARCVLTTDTSKLCFETGGYYIGPTIFDDVPPTARIAREEIFGPVACVIRAKGYDEALALANDTEFGLCSGIVTTSLKHASHFKRHAQAGMVMVNLPTAGVDYHVPFGGRKGSSYGPREQGRYAAEFYTTVKTAYTAP
jgi:aldehyde dehydrogenase (NAD+)